MFTLTGRWGRLNRLRFVGFGLMAPLLYLVFSSFIFAFILKVFLEGYVSPFVPMQIMLALSLFTIGIIFWIFVCIGIKRLHDLDQTGWFLLVTVIPVVNLIFCLWLLFWPGTKGDNQYGPDPRLIN